MKALVFDPALGGLRLVADRLSPSPRPGWAIVRPTLAGICRTDLEIVRGYAGFAGVLGHEFVGFVEASDETRLVGTRVVGEINAGCGGCRACLTGQARHCPGRTVLGIKGLDGCFAEAMTLPNANLHRVPDELSDEAAVFIEPLAAAHQILEQVLVRETDRVVVLGDGKLGILCAWVLSTASSQVTLVGRHYAKLEAARWNGIRLSLAAPAGAPPLPGGDVSAGLADADLVVDATGRLDGLSRAVLLCRPRGTLVLKSTVAAMSGTVAGGLDLAPAVVKELTIVGSRCGPFGRALAALKTWRFPVERLIETTYPLEFAPEALAHAGRPGSLKVLLAPAG